MIWLMIFDWIQDQVRNDTLRLWIPDRVRNDVTSIILSSPISVILNGPAPVILNLIQDP